MFLYVYTVFTNIAYVLFLGVFHQHMIWVHDDPMVFWLDVIDDVPELAKFARMVMSVRTHVAGCERVWSLSVAMVTKGHSRLDNHRFAEMVQVM